jgi:DNA integrity scanning protein DisA with diadenylate cyclase activity
MNVFSFTEQQAVDRFIVQSLVRQGYYLARTVSVVQKADLAIQKFDKHKDNKVFQFLDDNLSPEHIWKVLDVYTLEDLLNNISRFDEEFKVMPNIHSYWIGMQGQSKIQNALYRIRQSIQ